LDRDHGDAFCLDDSHTQSNVEEVERKIEIQTSARTPPV
jgi:hypothetical protein